MFYWPSVSLERSGRNCRVSVFYVTRQWRGEEKVDNQEAEATAVSQLFRSSHNDFRRMEKMNAKIEVEVNLEFSLTNKKDFSKNVHKFIKVEITPVNPIKDMINFFHE